MEKTTEPEGYDAELAALMCDRSPREIASEVLRLRAALEKVRHYLRPGDGSHYPHGTTYAVQEIDRTLAA